MEMVQETNINRRFFDTIEHEKKDHIPSQIHSKQKLNRIKNEINHINVLPIETHIMFIKNLS